MKLSEAIRLGAMLKPQGRGKLLKRQGDMLVSCALGAACDAAGIDVVAGANNTVAYGALRTTWLVLQEYVTHPEWGRRMCVLDVIYTLNDVCVWSRERIADWVETIEPACGAIMTGSERVKREEELCPISV